MLRLPLSSLFLGLASLFIVGQVPLFAQPAYCNISPVTLTATGRTAQFINSANQCHGWVLTYFSSGFSAVSIELDGSNDGGITWTAIPAVSGSVCTNPATNTGSCNITTDTYYKGISIAATLTGTGSLTARAYGVAGITASLGGSGGGGGSGITALTGDGTATGPGSAALTLATVNSAPGTCGDSTHVCQITTNGKGLTTSQTAVAISGGSSVIFPSGLVSSLPASPVTGQAFYVTNGASTSDCSTGGGSNRVLCIFFTSGGGGPATIANSGASSASVGGSSSQTFGPTASVTAGNIIVVSGSCQNAAMSSITDSLGTSYSLVTTVTGGSGSMQTYTGTAGSSGADTFTVSGASGCAIIGWSYYEVSNSGGVDVSNSVNCASPCGAPSITTTVAQDLLLTAGVSRSGTGTFTATSPTVLDNGGGGGTNSANAHTPTTTAGSYTPTFSNATSGANWFIVTAMKPASPPVSVWTAAGH